MIKHVVLFKLAPFAEGNSKRENALYLKDKLEGLESLIPELLKIEVVLNMPEMSADNFDLMLMTEFKNSNDLEVYIKHPEHQKVSGYISKVMEHRAAIDYQF